MPFPPSRQPLLNAVVRGKLSCRHASLIRRIDDGPRRLQLMRQWSRLNATMEARFSLVLRDLLDCEQDLPRPARVLCVVPYLADHEYLVHALKSIASQTYRPDRLVLAVDHASAGDLTCQVQRICRHTLGALIPYEIRLFQGLNGPYRMLNQIVGEHADVTHVWLHDSDDFSHGTRLAKQMAFMSRHRLDICSCFEIRLRSQFLELVDYPVHVSRALRIEPGHCMLWPGSLISRSLWEKLDGCSDRYRFGADTEFQLRASFIARMANYPAYLYARLIRENSLTGSCATGLRSWQRGYINSLYKAEYYRNQMLREAGDIPRLGPYFKV
jgi:hypothetical protein